MAELLTLTGTWCGEYQYDDGKTPAVSFTMSLQQAESGLVEGTVQDGRGGDPEPAIVKGRLLGSILVYEKCQLHRWVATHDGLARFEVAIAAIYPDAELEAADLPAITYHGAVSADGQTLMGTWLIRETILPTQSGGRAIRFRARTGSWSAVRQVP